MNKKEENRIYNVLKGSPLKFFDKNMKVSDSFADVINNIESCSSNTYKLLEIMTSSGAYKKESLLRLVVKKMIACILFVAILLLMVYLSGARDFKSGFVTKLKNSTIFS